MQKRIEPTEENKMEWMRIYTVWLQEGRPGRVRMPEGYYIALQDNKKLIWVLENSKNDYDVSSFEKVK